MLGAFSGLRLGAPSPAAQLAPCRRLRPAAAPAAFVVEAAASTPRERRIRRHNILRKKVRLRLRPAPSPATRA